MRHKFPARCSILLTSEKLTNWPATNQRKETLGQSALASLCGGRDRPAHHTSESLRPGDRTAGLAGKETVLAHIAGMEKYRSRMLEVVVTADQPPRWEWQVRSNGTMIANGFADEREKAKFEGNSAMFLLLAAGWNP
jgi:hypothetical protein